MSEAQAGPEHLLELLTATGCPRCAGARQTIRRVLPDYPTLMYREVDVTDDPEGFMCLGVLSTPAIRLDGEVVFTGAPTQVGLRQELERRTRPPRGSA